MALNFDYTKVATLPNGDDPTHAPHDRKKWHPVGDALVWASLSVGLGSITDKNVDKWIQRLAILQAMDGPLLRYTRDGEIVDAYITADDIRAFIGLSVNVSTTSDLEFAKGLLRSAPGRKMGDRPAYVIAHEQADRALANEVREQVAKATVEAEQAEHERAFEHEPAFLPIPA